MMIAANIALKSLQYTPNCQPHGGILLIYWFCIQMVDGTYIRFPHKSQNIRLVKKTILLLIHTLSIKQS